MPGTIPLSLVSTNSWFYHRPSPCLETPSAQVNKEESNVRAARDACLLRELKTFKVLQTLALPSQGHQKALKKSPEGLRGHVFSDNSKLLPRAGPLSFTRQCLA